MLVLGARSHHIEPWFLPLGTRQTLFSIGEFSKITGLSVKTLRFYHEQGVLAPSCVDEASGYRYYDATKIETARIIALLRSLDFSLNDVGDLLHREGSDVELLDILQRQKTTIEARIRQLKRVGVSLDQLIAQEKEARKMIAHTSFEIEEKRVDAMLIAGVRMRGRYADSGKGFARIGKQFGRQICGPCFLLHYDAEFREDDADFEACMPIRKGTPADGIDVRELPAAALVTLLHRGPCEQLGRAYASILAKVNARRYRIQLPTREVYLKGPGMIFRGNPRKYLTEIQLPIEK